MAKEPQTIKPSEDSANTPITKVMKVELCLQVENNSKFVRGKGKVLNEIEQFILSQFAMEKLNNGKGIFFRYPTLPMRNLTVLSTMK